MIKNIQYFAGIDSVYSDYGYEYGDNISDVLYANESTENNEDIISIILQQAFRNDSSFWEEIRLGQTKTYFFIPLLSIISAAAFAMIITRVLGYKFRETLITVKVFATICLYSLDIG